METPLVRPSFKQEIFERLRADIAAGRWQPGDRLPSFRDLAARYGVSIRPIQQALDLLEEAGYVARRQGVGTTVISNSPAASLTEAVGLGLEKGAHVYGALLEMLSGSLAQRGRVPVVLDFGPKGGEELLLRLARGGARRFVVHLHEHFDSSVFAEPCLREARYVGAIHWESLRLPRMSAVLTDPVAGARLWAEYLQERGHRHVLLVTPELRHLKKQAPLVERDRLHYGLMRQGAEFTEQWEAAGGTWQALHFSDPLDVREQVDNEVLLDAIDRADGPTAVVGVRDLDTFRVQTALLQQRPEEAQALDYLGYFDTPWSAAAPLPMVSVSIELETMHRRILEELEAEPSANGSGEPLILIPPRLVVAGGA